MFEDKSLICTQYISKGQSNRLGESLNLQKEKEARNACLHWKQCCQQVWEFLTKKQFEGFTETHWPMNVFYSLSFKWPQASNADWVPAILCNHFLKGHLVKSLFIPGFQKWSKPYTMNYIAPVLSTHILYMITYNFAKHKHNRVVFDQHSSVFSIQGVIFIKEQLKRRIVQVCLVHLLLRPKQ